MPQEQLPWDRKDFAFKERKQLHDRSEHIAPGPGPPPPPPAAGVSRWNDSFQQHSGFPPREFHHRWAPPPDFRRPLADRREGFFKERKHDRSESLGSQPRWRDSSSYHHGPRSGGSDGFHRWGSTEFRRPPGGHGKQGGWHMFPEESGHGYGTSRSSERVMEDDGFRGYCPRGDGRYGSRNNRDYRGFGSRDWRGGGHSSETSSGPPPNLSAPLRPHDVNSDRKSVDNAQACPAPSLSEFVNTGDSEYFQSKDQNGKMGGVDGPSAGQGCEKESRENSLGSIDWKPLKWTRSGSMNSRGSGLTNSGSSKGMTGVGSNEAKAESQPQDASPLQSPVENVTACVTLLLPEEATSKKKPRLGWGEGLAKYEKKKVEGPDDIANKDGHVPSPSNMEPAHSAHLNLTERSPRILGLPECCSPATPSSVACSSSSGLEEKVCVKASTIDVDVSNFYGSPSPGPQNHLEGFSNYLEKSESSINCVGFPVLELLHLDEPSSLDSSSGAFTAMNKLLLLKSEVLKELEMTESRIDVLENELKSTQSSSRVENDSKPGTCQHSPSDAISRPAGRTPLHTIPSSDVIGDNTPLSNDAFGETDANAKDVDADSPGTATSKIAEPLSCKDAVLSSDTVKNDEDSGNLSAVSSGCADTKDLVSRTFGSDTTICALNEVLLENQGSGKPDTDANDVYDLCNSILSENRESSEKAYKELEKLLPGDVRESSISSLNRFSGLQNGSLVEKKFVVQKRFQRFKERVLSIKYKIFRHMWKQNLHLLTIRKQRARSQKKTDWSLHYVQSGYQKRKASICSQPPSPGMLSLIPKTKIKVFTRKLLQDSQLKLCRSTLQMPGLILDVKDKNVSRFNNANGLVEDPCAVERERALINPWTSEEKEIFMDKLTEFGKDFRKIATFLEHKTSADCVEFYYKNHKADCFAKTKRQDLKKQAMFSTNTYLMMGGKKWNNAANLNVRGMISEVEAYTDDTALHKDLCSGTVYARFGESTTARADDCILERSSSYDTSRHERETMAADVLARMCVSLPSQPITSCISSSLGAAEGYLQGWYHKVNIKDKYGLTLDITEDANEEICSDDSCGEIDFDYWKDEEKSIFIQAFASYGKDFSKISQYVKTKSGHQCKIFFSKARKILGLDSMHSGPAAVSASPSDDECGGGSDTEEDACAIQAGPTAGCDKPGSEVQKLINFDHVAFGTSEKIDVKVDLNLSGGTKSNDTDDEVGDKDAKLEDFAPHSFQSEGRPESVIEGQSNGLNDLQIHQKAVATVDGGAREVQSTEHQEFVAEPVSLNETVDPSTSSSDSVDYMTELGETVRGGTGSGLDVSEVLVCDDHLCERDGKPNTSSDGNAKSQSYIQGTVQHSNSNVRISLVDRSKRVCQEHGPRKLARTEQPKVGSEQKDNSDSTGSLRKDLVVFQEGESAIQDSLSSTRDHRDNMDKQCHVGGDDIHAELFTQTPSNQVESSNTLQACLPTSTEVSRNMYGENTLIPSLLTSQKTCTGQLTAKDSHIRRCRSSKSHSSALELPPVSKSLDQKSDGSRLPLQNSSDTGKPSTNGDVRLFGQILNQPPQENTITNVQLNDSSFMHKEKSSNLKFIGHQNAAGSSTRRFDCGNNLALENFHMNHGYMDDRRMQSFSLPDSQILLAKYPAAFGNYSTSAKIQQQSLHSAVSSSEHGLNGASLFSTLESSGSNGVVDFQLYGSRDCSQVYPLKVGVQQQPQERFSEIQRYNSFEAMSALQQQGRAIGMNVASSGEIVVGGLRTAVQDPVAAIRMHYAKAEQFGVSSGIIRRQEESWRARGDIGR